jgi:uncharacterized protein YuzE
VKLQYSQTANALYIEFIADARAARTEEIDRGTLVDLDPEGRVIGIEVLNPARPWPLNEIEERFPLEMVDALALRALWRENAPYPYASPKQIAGAPAKAS